MQQDISIWQSDLPSSDASQPAPPHDPEPSLPSMPAQVYRSPYSSSGPSGPMFVDRALPSHARQIPGSTPSGSRPESPPTAAAPVTVPAGALPDPSDPNFVFPTQAQVAEMLIRHVAAKAAESSNAAAAESSTKPRLTLRSRDGRHSPKPESFYAPNAAELYSRATVLSAAGRGVGGENPVDGVGANHYPFSSNVPRLPPILQVEKQQVTTSATQAASASRRRNEANFACPVPGCGSTFTRRFNLRGHLRSHTEERPYVCDFPGCNKGFARQHDCKRHQALHTSQKSQSNVCQGCKKTFSRLDALNRHLRSDGGAECRQKVNDLQMLQGVKQQNPTMLETTVQ